MDEVGQKLKFNDINTMIMKRIEPQCSTVSIVSVVSALLFMACSERPKERTEHIHTMANAAHYTGSNETRLPVPEGGLVPIAFVIGHNAEVLDLTGPLEVFSAAWTTDWSPMFEPYFVADNLEPVTVSGNMRVLPDYTFENAPQPRIIVIPAMESSSDRMIEWIRSATTEADVTMSVCNGAFVLARTGLLDGKPAAAHHGGYFRFAGMFPKVLLQRGARYVEAGNVASAGGISSGIDLALRVVERYAGREQVLGIVEALEYQGNGWLDPMSNQEFANLPSNDPAHPICPLCFMQADTSIRAIFKGSTYYFCAESEKEFFETHPEVMERFINEDAARGALIQQ